MVQRKAPNLKHLSIQPHHLKPEDVRNRSSVADLKAKKMKKSGSIKRPELNSPRTPKPTKQPTKPTKTPNYMKSTTSSDARKDQSRAGADTATPRRRCSNSNSSKHTSCKNSAAKKASLKALTKNFSFKPARTSSSLVKKCSRAVLCEDLDVKRATCSSTLKDCKFPAYLSLNPGGTELEGTSAVKICPYTYCSLNGHHHAPVPPLKSFLSAKRRMIKAQRSFKLGCLSPRRAKPVIQKEEEEEDKNDFFVEIYTKENESIAENIEITEMDLEQNDEVEADEVISPELSIQEETKMGVESNVQSYEIDSEASDMDSETGFYSALFLDYAYEYSTEAENIEPDPDAETDETESHISNDEFVTDKSDSKDGCFDDFLVDDASQESYEMSLNSDVFSSSEDGESVASYDDLQNLNSMKNSAEPEISPSDEDFTNLSRVDSTQDKGHMDHKVKAENQEAEEDSLLTLSRGKSKKPVDESDELGAFNPREPNFLPIEPDPESEKVNLKHQDLDETKNTEEWMVDYALRQAVTKLGPARKKKVALLVEAFEKVMPITKWDIQTRHNTSMFDQARPMQACS